MERAVVALVVLALAGVPPALARSDATGGGSQRVATFHPMACPDGVFPDDRDVDCGYVVVPEDRHERWSTDPGVGRGRARDLA